MADPSDLPPPPPPPPPPVTSWPGAAPPPPPPAGGPVYGQGGDWQGGGWQPPPRSTSRTGLVLGIVAGAVVLFGIAVVALLIVVASGSDDAPVADARPGGPDQIEPPVDADDIAPNDVVAQTEAVLELIDASEIRMIEFQVDAFEELDEDGTLGSGAEAIATAAREAGDDLTTLRAELRALAGGEGDRFDGLRDVRDAYAEHMQAWIDYADAVAGSPALVVDGSTDAGPFWQDINDTGDDFVVAVEERLPQDLPAGLREFAEFILERGFTGGQEDPGGDLV